MGKQFDVDKDVLWALMDREKGKRTLRELGGGATQVAKILKSDAVTGVDDSPDTADGRRDYFGSNSLPEKPDVTFLELFMKAFEDQMMLLLIASAVLSLILGLTVPDATTGQVDWEHGWIEGSAILMSVLLVTVVTSVNDYQKEQKFKELSKAAPPTKVKVTRKGVKIEILESDLVVGDVVHVVGGMIVPVDAVLIKSVSLKTDESAVTGENDTIDKSVEENPFLLSGSNVVEGSGVALVVAVGEFSSAGRLAMAVRGDSEDTPMQEKLTQLADDIGKLGMIAAGLMVVVLLLKESIRMFYFGTGELGVRKVVDIVTTAVTIVVVAVPEGLPLSVTIALAYSMKQMMHENNLVRHLAACETMGGASSICTDKTGTLTQNEMSVMKGFIAGRQFELTGDRERDNDIVATQVEPHAEGGLLSLLCESVALNSTAQKRPNCSRYLGDKTESSMLQFVERLGANPCNIRASFPTDDVHLYPFTSTRKSMTTCVRKEKSMRYHVKGASEMILDACTHIHVGSGTGVMMRTPPPKNVEPSGVSPKPEGVAVLGDATRSEVHDIITQFAQSRLRCIAVAYADVPDKTEFDANEAVMPSLVLLGILGIEDPLRPEVPEAVARCKSAGVAVRMVTGDNKTTAIAIAKKAGIYGKVYWGGSKGDGGLALSGPEFREFAESEARLNIILPRLQVLARATPLDKQILVNALMERGEVVAVTGDGTNDAPALKKANVGFAMNSGTEVAKNASDVVILDDNFRSIVTAMKWGRNVNDNIRKFIQFQTTVNVAAVTIAFVGAVMSGKGESPLKPVQLLWLNLIMDTMAALALATERPSECLLDRQPRSRNAPLISRRMWMNILGQSAYQIILQLWLLNGGHRYFRVQEDSAEHLTIIFNIFVLMQVANEFNARILDQRLNVLRGLTQAPLFLVIIIITLGVQYVGVTYAGEFMRCVPLGVDQWQRCILLSLVPLPLGLILRLLPVKEADVPLYEAKEVDVVAEAMRDPVKRRRALLKGQALFRDAGWRIVTQLRVVAALAAAVDEEESD